MDGAEQTPGGGVMRQQSHGFPVNGLNERILFRKSEARRDMGYDVPGAGGFLPHDVKVVCYPVVWQKDKSPVVNFH